MVAGADTSRHEDIERRLREALEEAEGEFRRARAQCLRVLANRKAPGDTTDGLVAMKNAVMWQRVALQRYGKALLEFTGFVLDGRFPE